jgi:hypothetical protein
MHDDKPDQFVDDLLEASLERYRGEEPRPGLEMRVLAGIRTRERPARRRWLGWAVAVCAGTVAIIVVVLHFTRAPVRQPTRRASLSSKESGAHRAPLQPANPREMVTQQQPSLRPRGSGSVDPRFWGPRLVQGPEKPRTPKAGVRATKPKRPEQFPTPSPLTEQEKLLLVYVNIATKPDLVAGTDETDEAPVSDLEIPRIKIVALEIKPLEDSQSEQGK